MIKAVLFDCDGVLIDSERVHQRYNIQFGQTYLPTLKPEDFHVFVGCSTRLMDQVLWPALCAKAGVDIPQEELRARFDAYKAEKLAGLHYGTILFPDIPATLRALKDRGLQIACASSSSMPYLKQVMDQCRIGRYFDLLVTGHDFKESKPAPDIYLHCARAFSLRPEECLVIEDSPYGIQAARAAGMEVLARRDTQFSMDQTRATALFDDAGDILAYLDKLGQ